MSDAALLSRLFVEAEQEWGRLEEFSKYHRGIQRDPYTPKQITPEFQALKERSKTNLLPLVTSTLVDRLYIDGYRPDAISDEDSPQDDSPQWGWWQHNGMDARQKLIFQSTSVYGYSFVQVWPGETSDGDPVPVFSPRSPRSWYAHYDYPDDDWPVAAVRRQGRKAWMLDVEGLHQFEKHSDDNDRPWSHVQTWEHPFDVTPLVRFMNSWPDEDQPPVGEVEPLLGIQDRINQSVFDLLVAQTYQGAPQQYVSGVVADTSEVVKAIAKRVWTFDEPNTQVGQLPPANLDNLVHAIENALRIFGLKSQTPPHYLLGEMVNIAADALAAAEAGLAAKVENRQTMDAESGERMFRLGGVAIGDEAAARDTSSQVIWRPTDPRSLGATVDALGKMVSQLRVPADETWTMIPGVSQQDAERWRRKAEQGDPFVQMEQELDRQAASLGIN